jgi:hypothetical protein
MKAEEKNALFLLGGIGVTAWILYAVNAKAGPDAGAEPRAGETWLVAIWIDPPDFTDRDKRRLAEEYSATADVESASMVTENVLGLVLKYKVDAKLPPVGTEMPWGTGTMKFLRAERY